MKLHLSEHARRKLRAYNLCGVEVGEKDVLQRASKLKHVNGGNKARVFHIAYVDVVVAQACAHYDNWKQYGNATRLVGVRRGNVVTTVCFRRPEQPLALS